MFPFPYSDYLLDNSSSPSKENLRGQSCVFFISAFPATITVPGTQCFISGGIFPHRIPSSECIGPKLKFYWKILMDSLHVKTQM